MAHTRQNQKKLLSRVRRIRGQCEGVERALESGDECMAVLQQIAAIRGAVNGLMHEVLEGHLRGHLGDESRPAPQRQQDLDEVVALLRSYLR